MNMSSSGLSRRVSALGCLLGVTFSAGCRDDPPQPAAGSLTAMLASAPVTHFDEDVVFGLSGGSNDDLSFPDFVGRDEQGYVYILDRIGGLSELKRFAPSGEFDRLVVRGGDDGPFSWLRMESHWMDWGLWVESSSRIYIWSPVTADLLTFNVAGEMTSRNSWARVVQDFDHLVPVGRYDSDFLASFRRHEPSGDPRPILHQGYLRLREDGAVVDTVWSSRHPADRLELTRPDGRRQTVPLPSPVGMTEREGTDGALFARPFGAEGVEGLMEVRVPEPGGADHGRITLRVVGADGTDRTETFSYRPIEIPVQERRSRLMERYQDRDRYSRAESREIEGYLHVQRYVPPFLSVGSPRDGSGSVWFWVASTPEALSVPDPEAFPDVLVAGLDGRDPTRLSLPPHRSLSIDRDGTIWLTRWTEGLEPYVVSLVPVEAGGSGRP